MRAIAYIQPGRLRLESRNLNDITEAYPEVRGLLRDIGMHDAVLDGEIVAFDEAGRPSFERLQRRMHVRGPTAIRRLSASVPVVYAIFDLLYLDGHSLMDLPTGSGASAWRRSSWAARPGAFRRRIPARGAGCSRRRARRGSRASWPSASTPATRPGGGPAPG